MLAQGPEVAAFEQEFSQIVEGRRCIALNSGTSALHLAFLAAGVGPGDEIIVPSFSFAATANAVSLTGATPVFAEIEIDHFALDPKAAEAAITPRTRGIMPVHLYGHPADMKAFSQIAEKHKLTLFEDAAQAHAATVAGRPVGAWSTAASFSFYPTKNMTSGEGGMIVTDSAEVERLARMLRNQGMERRYENEVVGFNTRMTDIHAAIGRVQLRKLENWTMKRQQNAAFLNSNLEGVVVPPVAADATHVYHQYTVRIVDHDRDAFAEELAKRGVGTGVYYPTPIHRLPSFRLELDLPISEQAAKEALSLPVYPSLTQGELETIVEVVNSVAKAGS
ncbi:MAG: DegT/DnrJ/EryC1/StrS family aminotransferase [Microbacteriaceae bacterium]|nr:DegT/DnrJ/EryC1/StrS family aminotransferase [Microbacteriaceae bacterium]